MQTWTGLFQNRSFAKLLIAIFAAFAFASSTLVAAADEHDHDHDEPHHSECFVYTLPAKGISSPPPIAEIAPVLIYETVQIQAILNEIVADCRGGSAHQARAPPYHLT
ncbi:MAG: hypothetical protein AAFX02_01170 [Pseudomonadota bacterium]